MILCDVFSNGFLIYNVNICCFLKEEKKIWLSEIIIRIDSFSKEKKC